MNEEYFVSLNKIFQSESGRELFVDILKSAVTHNNQHDGSTYHCVWLSKHQFQHLKHAIDLFLYEAQDHSDYNQVLRILPMLDYFCMKTNESQQQNSVKMKVKDHIVWKSERIWRVKMGNEVAYEGSVYKERMPIKALVTEGSNNSIEESK